MTFCTGFGASDTHAVVLNDGRPNPHPSAGEPYPTTTLNDIWAMVQNPPTAEKDKGQWIVPSSYNAHNGRSHKAQRANGVYGLLAADIDRGNPDLLTVLAAVRRVLGDDICVMVYATRSATAANQKWRVLVPLAATVSGEQYGPFQAAFFDALEYAGLTMDRTLERPGQLVYLPNRGDWYEYSLDGQTLLDPHAHPMAERAKQYQTLRAEAEANTGQTDRREGSRSPLRAFREKHSIQDMLRTYGYVQGSGDNWRSPYQTTGGFATKDNGDHWFSLSDSDGAAGLGRAVANGGRYGDAFDLYVHYQCGGDRELAMAYARQCLKEEEDQRYGDATVEHGAQVVAAFLASAQKQSDAIADALRNEIKVEGSHNSAEWDIDWPPGLIGEVAKWIYNSSSRPIKQYSIAAALYFYSVAARKYNIDGSGLNLFILLVGETGRGKGVVKSAVDRLTAAIMEEAQNPALIAPFMAEIAVSESGIRKSLSKQNPICAYEEELGMSLVPLTSPKASTNDSALRKMLTRLYDSGESRFLGSKDASDQDRARDVVSMPTFTLAGDTQPHIFRSLLGTDLADSGFGPRMLQFYYYGPRKHHNRDSANHRRPPEALTKALRTLLEYCLTTGEAVNHVEWDPAVQEAHYQFDEWIDDRINAGGSGIEMMNRAAANVARVAALLAVGCNHIRPVIDQECYAYARHIVEVGIKETQRITSGGGIGSGENVRVFKLREAIRKFVSGEVNVDVKNRDYKTPKAILHDSNLINEAYFVRMLGSQADFAGGNNRLPEENVKETIATAEWLGILEQATGVVLDRRTKQKIYRVGPDY